MNVMNLINLSSLADVTLTWWWALLLLPVPLVVWVFSKDHADDNVDDNIDTSNSNIGALRVPFFQQLSSTVGQVHQSKDDKKPPRFSQWWKWLLLTLSWVFLVLAFSRPTLVGEKIPLPVAGRDIMMAIDLSGSMAAEDLGIAGNRLDAVKATANEFISRRAGDRIGLIFFSDQAYLQSPLTFDRTVVQALLSEASVGLTGQRTAIGDAMAIGLKRLRETQAQLGQNKAGQNEADQDDASLEDIKDSRVLILLTDGANNAGVTPPEKATEIAQKLGIKVYTIGVGGKGQTIATPFGRSMFVGSDLDEPALQRIAEQTGGRYFRATDMADLEQIYQVIDQLEPVNRDPKFLYPQVALYYYPAIVSLLLFSSLMMMSGVSMYRKNSKQRRQSQASLIGESILNESLINESSLSDSPNRSKIPVDADLGQRGRS